jgi:hypothetical protein
MVRCRFGAVGAGRRGPRRRGTRSGNRLHRYLAGARRQPAGRLTRGGHVCCRLPSGTGIDIRSCARVPAGEPAGESGWPATVSPRVPTIGLSRAPRPGRSSNIGRPKPQIPVAGLVLDAGPRRPPRPRYVAANTRPPETGRDGNRGAPVPWWAVRDEQPGAPEPHRRKPLTRTPTRSTIAATKREPGNKRAAAHRSVRPSAGTHNNPGVPVQVRGVVPSRADGADPVVPTPR